MPLDEKSSILFRWIKYVGIGATLLVWITGQAAADVWLAGEDPVVQRELHKDVQKDYMDLFKAAAPWATAARGLKVFKISMQFALRGSDEQVRALFDDLKRRHISLAVEAGLLVGTDRCGKGVEGYAAAAGIDAMAKRIAKLGGQLEYLAMDSPVWFGHTSTGGRGGPRCMDSIADLVNQVAPKIAILRQYFPNVAIGDIDPVNAKSPQIINDIITFTDALRQKTKVAPAFVHADMAWSFTGWQPLLANLAAQLRARRIRFGVICDGDADVGGDVAWVNQALDRCKSVAANPKTRPDDFIVQTWEPLPTRMLPETDPGTLTYEVKQAIALFH